MTKRIVLTRNQKVDIIDAYTNQLTPMIELADKYGITRQGIYKILKKAGVDTTTQRFTVSCTACGNKLSRPKSKVRRQLNHFCSTDCYYAFLAAGNGFPYLQNRHGQMQARSIVSQYFSLQEDHVVHHEDRNTLNNRLDNLKVFACNGDHVRYH
jgi:hypothetical protein